MIGAAQSEPDIPILPENFDRDSMLLNVLNGTIDLKTAHLRPHDRKDFITKLAPVEYHERGRLSFVSGIFKSSHGRKPGAC